MFETIEALFFNGSYQLAVTYERRRSVPVVCVYAKYVHGKNC
jgi:hypothetical protein